MVFWQSMFQRLDQSRGRNRTRNKSNPYGDKRLWGKRLRGQSRPKTVTISGHRDKAVDSVGLDKVIDLPSLHICRAVISHRGNSVIPSWPWLRQTLRQVLQIGSHVERGRGIAPYLPGRLRGAQAFQKPRLLLGAKDRLRWPISVEIRNLHATESD